jgi:hypothetical protein
LKLVELNHVEPGDFQQPQNHLQSVLNIWNVAGFK